MNISLLFLLINFFIGNSVEIHSVRLQFGDNEAWKKVSFDDSNWSKVEYGESWEDQGFWKYDGYAWYRIHFTVKNINPNRYYWIHLGRLDDVDASYLNEKLIGTTGTFPPNYVTAYHQKRKYLVSGKNLLGENVLAIRIFDERQSGGALDGNIKIEESDFNRNILATLDGSWQFKTGDNEVWALNDYDDSNWEKLKVQQVWEYNDYWDYDGFAWYRTNVTLKDWNPEQAVYIDLGLIDDANQAFINGTLIGQHGQFYKGEIPKYDENTYRERRIYRIPNGLIGDGDLTIAVRVYDGYLNGGMYEGVPMIYQPLSDNQVNQKPFIIRVLIAIWKGLVALFKFLF